jgi:hypothetical protein
MIEPVMNYLTERRMSSIGNVVLRLGCSISKLMPVIKLLESNNRLRLSIPRCGRACSSCDGCAPATPSQIVTESTILISLEKQKERV